ncbi:MAG TPA: hypothetical protein VM282_27870 [Acidimicrobiales bacterium]|nr:hypothetical protein [Acidimicrobiales bacterium]
MMGDEKRLQYTTPELREFGKLSALTKVGNRNGSPVDDELETDQEEDG